MTNLLFGGGDWACSWRRFQKQRGFQASFRKFHFDAKLAYLSHGFVQTRKSQLLSSSEHVCKWSVPYWVGWDFRRDLFHRNCRKINPGKRGNGNYSYECIIHATIYTAAWGWGLLQKNWDPSVIICCSTRNMLHCFINLEKIWSSGRQMWYLTQYAPEIFLRCLLGNTFWNLTNCIVKTRQINLDLVMAFF